MLEDFIHTTLKRDHKKRKIKYCILHKILLQLHDCNGKVKSLNMQRSKNALPFGKCVHILGQDFLLFLSHHRLLSSIMTDLSFITPFVLATIGIYCTKFVQLKSDYWSEHHIHFVILLLVVLHLKSRLGWNLFVEKKMVDNNPETTKKFYRFQGSYVLIFLTVMLADWMQVWSVMT
ncbi:hypothetical protein RFI_24379 [Reticulomyxa filosa]|uniref:Uncharacterized protein n=1 Tax=Reticulomyxa filosa TaxID=46433 RepID=X6MIV6_RETFI|nr:hypothetical protein RFI_24379 [Reticulomyxa filosa]|eukprot:ETO12995.1 hypothetical protein RFI_24379 [Reticulomyxa filosa]